MYATLTANDSSIQQMKSWRLHCAWIMCGMVTAHEHPIQWPSHPLNVYIHLVISLEIYLIFWLEFMNPRLIATLKKNGEVWMLSNYVLHKFTHHLLRTKLYNEFAQWNQKIHEKIACDQWIQSLKKIKSPIYWHLFWHDFKLI